MKLSQILQSIMPLEVKGDIDVEITGLTTDSRHVEAGNLFICLRGKNFNGHDFIAGAISKGAAAVICDSAYEGEIAGTYVRVLDTDKILAPAGSFFYGAPSRKMRVYAMVGTNGKTTSTYLLKSILEQAGHKTGLIGTIKYIAGSEEIAARNTTPNALELQQLMAKMVSKGITHLVMEVSSHAIKLGRIDCCHFSGAVFTNITQDHLDFHGTFQEYLDVKSGFFASLPPDTWAAVNLDDPHADVFISKTRAKIVTYSKNNEQADVFARAAQISPAGIEYELKTAGDDIKINLNLTGEFNISNSLGVAALAYKAEGIPLPLIKKGLESVCGVNGRMERVPVKTNFTILVDYAHTPDALENLLRSVRRLSPRRMIVVFGCGGDRDRTKRPLMGEIAARYSDYIIVTSDNPRSENPGAIMNDIQQGILSSGFNRYQMLEDRREAIFSAVSMAEQGDVIVIAGKGHETYQIFSDHTVHFDDREVAQEAVEELRNHGKIAGQ